MSLLGQTPIGRVAVSMHALPVVLPVNYVLLDGCIVFPTVRGSGLNDALAGAVVAFEIDGYDADQREGWSVLVQGMAEVVADAGTLLAVQAFDLATWAAPGEVSRYVRIRPATVTGRRVRRARTVRTEPAPVH